jgi:hypothetical protein
MSLARELLKRARRDAVLQFFIESKAFWKDRRVDAWITQVQDGQLPVLRKFEALDLRAKANS